MVPTKSDDPETNIEPRPRRNLAWHQTNTGDVFHLFRRNTQSPDRKSGPGGTAVRRPLVVRHVPRMYRIQRCVSFSKFAPENQSSVEHYSVARAFTHRPRLPTPPGSPLFVTWEVKHTPPLLRGCIGTMTSRHVKSAIGEYALLAGVRDSRFHPITKSELKDLQVKVSLLHSFETDLIDALDWDLDLHGISVDFVLDVTNNSNTQGATHSATYLPGVAKSVGWSKRETLTHLAEKAGVRETRIDRLLQSAKVTRYRSSVETATWEEYAVTRKLPL
mgnify:CR=1 FL=1